jgi:nitroreductase
MSELKQAKTDHPVLPLIAKRWSPYVWEDRPVEPSKLKSLFEAARWAPSSYNEQPWEYVIGIKGEGDGHDKILSCLIEFNQGWAKQVPVLAISVASMKFKKNGNPNAHGWHDVGLASAFLCLQAVDLGLYVHQMAGFDHEKAKKVLGVPDGYETVAAIAIGYRGDVKKATEKVLIDRDLAERTRRPIGEFVHQGGWKKSAFA